MTLTGKIQNTKIVALADSGSHLNIISADCYNRLNPRPKLERPEYHEIVGVSGIGTPVAGLATIKLKIGNLSFDIACHVLNGPRYDVIIGRDFFDENVGDRINNGTFSPVPTR